MFDSKNRDSFYASLSEPMQRIVRALEGREPWVIHNSEDIEDIFDELGQRLSSHESIKRLDDIETSDLTTLFIGLTLTRYLSALNRLSSHETYAGILQRLHNHIDPTDIKTGNRQRLLISRLQALVKFEVIERIYNKRRRELIDSLLEIPHA